MAFNSDKLKGLSNRELAGYVWDYYRWHIIGAVIAVFIAANLIDSLFINPPAKQYACVIIFGEQVDYSAAEALSALLTQELALSPGYMIATDNFYSGGLPQPDMAMSQRFAAILAAGEADIIICPQRELTGLISNVGLMPIDAVLPADTEGELTAYAPQQGYVIELTGSAILSACGIGLERPVAVFPASLKRTRVAALLLRALAKK